MKNELQEYVNSIREELIRLYENDPSAEEMEEAEENGESVSLLTYIGREALDYEFAVSSRCEYLGAVVWVTLGGPNVCIDTRHGEVRGAWGTERASAWIPSEVCEEMDEFLREEFEIMRQG